MSVTMMMSGGCSATQPDTAEVQAIADNMKFQLEERENKKFPTFKATEFKSQLVTGTNYFIKVQVEMMILYTFECLEVSHMKTSLWPCTYQTKTEHDELTYF